MNRNNIDLNDKEQVKSLIESGIPCYYRLGFSYHFRSNDTRPISKEEAIDLLPRYSPGWGFYELSLTIRDGQDALLFNEFSENDLM